MVNAIIVAGGKGVRMSLETRKQYLPIQGKSIIARTLSVFDSHEAIAEIILVLPREDLTQGTPLLKNPSKPVHVVAGGLERQNSVFNGLMGIRNKREFVLVHDGVRPFISHDAISKCIAGAHETGACIMGIPIFDTLKRTDENAVIVGTTGRENLWAAQTPQVFTHDLILRAHTSAIRKGYKGTDDASLVERIGGTVKMIRGSRTNIKITTRDDLAFAEKILGFRKTPD